MERHEQYRAKEPLAVETEGGKIYDLRVDPHDMFSSGGDSSITLFIDKYEAIIKAKDIEELCDLIFDTVDLDGEFWDEREVTWEVCMLLKIATKV